MLYDDHMKDRFCRFTYNPQTSEYERNWIQYADNTFEPVRRVGNLKKKFEAQRTDFNWWTVKKPAQWRPWHEGHGFSWNHTLGEETKPKNWGNKSKRERKAGATPYFLQLDLNDTHRIESRTERINGRRETWEFEYDDAGRLTSVIGDTGWCEDFEYDDKGRRKADYAVGREPFMRSYQYTDDDRLLAVDTLQFEHDALGFRSAKINGESITRYKYSKDYRLLGALLPDGREITFDHDEHGRRQARYVNGTLDEAYQWKDFIRLDRFKDEVNDWQFHYDKEERIPYKATVNGTDYTLYYDQVGSLKAVVSPTGNVVKAIQYGPFGNILWDSNPTLRVPIGFAGGVHDPDTGFVRFGWRDYDPDTARWTAQDPIGDAGGDADWYGYCLDDPVNMVDSSGLMGAFDNTIEPHFPDEWQWQANANACEKCQALDGTVYSSKDEAPDKPHPNCNCVVIKCEFKKEYGEWTEVDREVIGYKLAAVICFGASCVAAWHQIFNVQKKREAKTIRTCGSRTTIIETKIEKSSKKEREIRKAPAIAVYQGGDPEAGDVYISTNPWNLYDTRQARRTPGS